MIRDPMGIIAVLLAIEGAILWAAELPPLRRLFRFIPSMFWIYFLPMVASTAGLIPSEQAGGEGAAVYKAISANCLPACLVLLLLNVDLRRIWRLGPRAVGVFLAGSLGILVGGPVVMLIFGRWLPADIWKGLGALAASWTGGSSNLIAVAESLQTPNAIRGMAIVVDTIVPYAWMGVLVLLSGQQERFDRWNRSNAALLEELRRRSAAGGGAGAGAGEEEARPITLRHAAALLAVAGVTGYAAIRLAAVLPTIPGMIERPAWAIILATTLALALSFTPIRRLERYGSSSLGYALLYFVLASLGARTSLAGLGGAPVLLAAGLVWVLIHAAFLLAAARLLRAPLALAATASQANLGGTASAPVVAEVYQPGLAPVGLLLAVLGNLIGTYLGIACAALCRLVGG